MKIDLHVHSHYSDGTLSPRKLMEMAKEKGVDVLSLTDHDNVTGIQEMKQYADLYGVEFIPGIEISGNYGKQEFHILGYYIDHQCEALHQGLETWGKIRFRQVEKMCRKLNELGYGIYLHSILEMAKTRTIGIHLLGLALKESGYVQSIDEANRKLVSKQSPAYVERENIEPGEIIRLIQRSGGIPVLAHPCISTNLHYIPELIDQGLKGIEVHYPRHTEADAITLLQIAKTYRLLVTGGSDYHGPLGAHSEDGVELGCVNIPQESLLRMKDMISGGKENGHI
ncbi:PHP domain-containing protein [Anaerosolibacter sp.]|uniref:PHP domain-containing protein n=1 Tax=Anaerosolibacter sp. TaxID=1872527 RepID=UPI0039EFBB2D